MKIYFWAMFLWWSIALLIQIKELSTKSYPYERKPMTLQMETGVLVVALIF